MNPWKPWIPEARRIIEQILMKEAGKGRTIFLSSHDLFSTQRLCSQVTFLHHGRVLRDGPVSELLQGLPGRLHVQFRIPVEHGTLPKDGGMSWSGAETNWQVTFSCPIEHIMDHLAKLPLAGIRDDGGNLEDLFDRLYEDGGDA